jgi:hypothetical protein
MLRRVRGTDHPVRVGFLDTDGHEIPPCDVALIRAAAYPARASGDRYSDSLRDRSDPKTPDGSTAARSRRNSSSRGYIPASAPAGTRESFAR